MFKKMLALVLLPCMLLGALAACTPASTNPPVGPGGDGEKCPTCGKDPCECPPTGTPCPLCGKDPCACPAPDKITYVQTYPYTDKDGVVHIRYQDKYTFHAAISEIRDVNITSCVTGTTEKDENLLVKQADGKTVYADGCGTATVVVGGSEVKIKVDPSPINMLFTTGQSNASGDLTFADTDTLNSYRNDFVRSPETMAYLTQTDQLVSVDPEADQKLYEDHGMQIGSNRVYKHYSEYVPTTLDWETTSTAQGCDPRVLTQAVTSFYGAGWSASLAKEWIEQTGERVWIVNCSHGAMEIQQFLPVKDGDPTPKRNEYYQAIAVFNAALETLYKEVDAGHFTLHHIAYYWYQGEANSYDRELGGKEYVGGLTSFIQYYDRGCRYTTPAEYVELFTRVHTGIMENVKYDHNGVTKSLEYCGIMTIRTNEGDGVNTMDQIKMTGARTAHYYMGGSKEGVLSNVYVISNLTEQWTGESPEEADANVEAYFLEKYGSPEAFREKMGYKMPTTSYEVHPNAHYNMCGHNELGQDCAKNSLRLLNMLNPDAAYRLSYEDSEETVEPVLTTENGYGIIRSQVKLYERKAANGATYYDSVVFPTIKPLHRLASGLQVRVNTPGFTWENYVLKTTTTDKSLKKVSLTVTFEGKDYNFDLSVAYR